MDGEWMVVGWWKEMVGLGWTRNQKQKRTMVVTGSEMRSGWGSARYWWMALDWFFVHENSTCNHSIVGEAYSNLRVHPCRLLWGDSDLCVWMISNAFYRPICLRFRKNIVEVVSCLRKNQCKMTRGHYFRRYPLNSWPRFLSTKL